MIGSLIVTSTRTWLPRIAAVGLMFLPATGGHAQVAQNVFSKYKPRVEKSVDKALAYLAANQKADGTFAEQWGYTTGVVSLVGMAFLSKGYTPDNGPYKVVINRCIDYVLRQQRDNGVLARRDAGNGEMYSHNISTLFLSEVSGMLDPSRQRRVDEALAKGIKLLLDAQAVNKPERHKGGWRYHPHSGDSDLSCSGWALMALRSAKLNGAQVPDQAIEDAVGYVYRNHDRRMGTFGYMGKGDHKESLTGCGLLCLELCGHHGNPQTVVAGEWILKNHKSIGRSQFPAYGNYYNAQGMFQLGGKYWEKYATWMYDTFLKQQQKDGSWIISSKGKTYTTAMMVLAFTVPYRQLPIYQRDETVNEEE